MGSQSVCCRTNSFCMVYSSMKILRMVKNSNDLNLYMQVYDIEREQGYESMVVEFKMMKDLSCMGQLVYDNAVYLCGTSNLNKDINYGSFFFKFEQSLKLQVLTSTIYSHYRPSMLAFKLDDIVVIGGKGSIKCEKFLVSCFKWVGLPDLPESRFGSNLISDDENSVVYLFGGYCEDTNRFCSTVLRLNMKKAIFWETLIFKDTNQLLRRGFSGVYKNDNNVFLLGGKKLNFEESDELVEIHLLTRTVKEKTIKLHHSSSFMIQKGTEYLGNVYFFEDLENDSPGNAPSIYKFDRYNHVEKLSFTG